MKTLGNILARAAVLLIVLLIIGALSGCSSKSVAVTQQPCTTGTLPPVEYQPGDIVYVATSCDYGPEYGNKNYKEFCNTIDDSRCPSYCQEKATITDVVYEYTDKKFYYRVDNSNSEYGTDELGISPGELQTKYLDSIIDDINSNITKQHEMQMYYINQRFK